MYSDVLKIVIVCGENDEEKRKEGERKRMVVGVLTPSVLEHIFTMSFGYE